MRRSQLTNEHKLSCSDGVSMRHEFMKRFKQMLHRTETLSSTSRTFCTCLVNNQITYVDQIDLDENCYFTSPILHICHLRRKRKALNFGIFCQKQTLDATIFVPWWKYMNYIVYKVYTLSSGTPIKWQKQSIQNTRQQISISDSYEIWICFQKPPHSCACQLLLQQNEPSNRQEIYDILIYISLQHSNTVTLLSPQCINSQNTARLVIFLYFNNLWCIFCFIKCTFNIILDGIFDIKTALSKGSCHHL